MTSNGGVVAERLDRREVERARALAAADHEDRGGVRVDAEHPSAGGAGGLGDGAADRTAGDEVLRPGAAREREGEGDAARQRRREPVGDAQVRVGLHQQERTPGEPRRQGDRSAHVAAAAEDDVGAPAQQQGRRAGGRQRREHHRPEVAQRQPPREAVQRDQVLRIAGARHGARCPGAAGADEPDLSAPRPERVGDRQGRHHVAARPARRDRHAQGRRPLRDGWWVSLTGVRC